MDNLKVRNFNNLNKDKISKYDIRYINNNSSKTLKNCTFENKSNKSKNHVINNNMKNKSNIYDCNNAATKSNKSYYFSLRSNTERYKLHSPNLSDTNTSIKKNNDNIFNINNFKDINSNNINNAVNNKDSLNISNNSQIYNNNNLSNVNILSRVDNSKQLSESINDNYSLSSKISNINTVVNKKYIDNNTTKRNLSNIYNLYSNKTKLRSNTNESKSTNKSLSKNVKNSSINYKDLKNYYKKNNNNKFSPYNNTKNKSFNKKDNNKNNSSNYYKNNNNSYKNSPSNDKIVVLYEDFKRLQFKKDQILKCKKDAEASLRIPKITKVAKDIIRNSNEFQKRLYPYYKVDKEVFDKNNDNNINDYFDNNPQLYKIIDNDNIYNIKQNKCFDNDNKIYRKSSLSSNTKRNEYSFSARFNPEINKNSKIIASKLEPSFQRLTSKRNKSKNSNYSINNSFRTNSNGVYNAYNIQNRNLNSNKGFNLKTKVSTHCKKLYENGLKKMHEKDKKHRDKLNKNLNDACHFSFKPKINRLSSLESKNYYDKLYNNLKDEDEFEDSNLNSDIKDNHSDYYNKSINWLNNKQLKCSKSKRKEHEYNMRECTFSPNIEKENIPSDENFIKRNLSHIYGYVKKRRDFLKNEKEKNNKGNKLIAINKFREINNKNPYDKTIIFNVDLKNSQLNLSNKRSNSKDKIKFYRNLTNTNVFYNKN